MARIAFLLPDMGGGGAERIAISLVEGFLARGHDVDLVLQQRVGVLLSAVPARARIVDLGAPRLRDGLLPLLRYLRSDRPDAMQVSMWPLTIVGLLAATLAGGRTRVVTSDHSTLSRQYAGQASTLRLLRWSSAAFYPRAAGVVAVSAGVADDLKELSGLPKDRITVIPNPVPAPPYDPASDRKVEPLWCGATHRLLACGSLKREKNFANFLNSLAHLDRSLDWHAIILGEGPLRAELESQARALGIADRVAMPGFAPDPSPYFRTATNFVLSSDFEGWPTVLIEALHAGLGIVATDCRSGPSEMIGDGGGTLVPIGESDALAAAIAEQLANPLDPDRQRSLGRRWSGDTAPNTYLRLMGLAR